MKRMALDFSMLLAVMFSTLFLLGAHHTAIAKEDDAGAKQKCLATDPEPTPVVQWPKMSEKKAGSLACWISMDQAQALEKSLPITWVDVRPGGKAKANPLNGVLQLAVQDLPDRSFLHQGKVILIGTGFDQALLEQHCQTLRNQGLNNIQALEGGVQSWVRAGRFMGGELPQWDEVSPEDLLQAITAENWQIISIGLSDEEASRLPKKPLQQWPAPEKLSEQLLKWQKTSKKIPPHIVIVARSANDALTFKQVLTSSPQAAGLLWLQGGLETYQRYVVTQQQMIRNAGRPLSKPCGAV